MRPNPSGVFWVLVQSKLDLFEMNFVEPTDSHRLRPYSELYHFSVIKSNRMHWTGDANASYFDTGQSERRISSAPLDTRIGVRNDPWNRELCWKNSPL